MKLLHYGPFAMMVAVSLAALIAPRVARAEPPTSEACVEAFQESQRLSKSGKLLAALDQLIICAQPSCPQFLTRECTTTFERIKSSLPTVTFVARNSAGEPLVDVVVTMDGKKLADKIEGLAVPVDPGLHEFTFQRGEEKAVTVSTLVSEGERNKQVVAEFAAPEPQPAPVPAKAAATPPPAPEPKKGIPTATYVLGGVGIAALATGITFRLLGSSDYNELVADCGRSCEQSDVDRVKTKYTISSIGLGVGAGALVAAGVVLLVGGRGDGPAERASASTWSVRPAFSSREAGGFVEGHF
jgi:hypothetical protein